MVAHVEQIVTTNAVGIVGHLVEEVAQAERFALLIAGQVKAVGTRSDWSPGGVPPTWPTPAYVALTATSAPGG